MLRSKSRADSGSEEPSNDRINVVDENNKENANNGVPLSPGGPSMRHKIKQSFTNFASRLTPEETKTVLRKPSPFARASKTDTETAATVPLPESPRSGTPLSNTNSSPSKSPAKSPAKPPSKSRRYLSFLLSPESKYKMDSKTATSLLATTCPAGEVKRKGEAPARDDAEAKSLASIKKEIAGKPAGASILSPPAAAPSPSPVGKENQPTTTTTTTDKAKGMNKLKAKNKTKPATPSSQAAAAATARQPTPIPRSVLAPPPRSARKVVI
ncbi:uncharacterized protein DFL_004871 [Arthrobotrys flagrans]|uniref:Uncharacterized protein n=1 Tax=Arthrobotrys flagrans TaxID=97331 RepID=A0A437A672_ARTFL|nr:hypothetical protein DFL_004871 [Arthrobotrys flagrans]